MASEIIGNPDMGDDGTQKRDWPVAVSEGERFAMSRINSALEGIEAALRIARNNMRQGGRHELVRDMMEMIKLEVCFAHGLSWPDPRARLAEAARCDRGVQKLIKKASRKTPI